MPKSYISGTLESSITLGSGLYGTALSITSAGVVQGISPGGTAITGGASGLTLNNAGTIEGADARMTLITGYFIGPADSRVYTYSSVDYSAAGDGVSLVGATFSNTGVVFGGTGPSAIDAGVGLYLAYSSGVNSGLIHGGATWGKLEASTLATNGDAASGATFVSGYFQNQGTILGGTGLAGSGPDPYNNLGMQGGDGGTGVIVKSGAILVNAGLLQGGQGGTGGAGGTFSQLRAGFPPVETFAGGTGGLGGAGVYISGSTLVNSGIITGGFGGVGGLGQAQLTGQIGQEGVGVVIQSGFLINAGTIVGGGDAVSFIGAGTLQVDATSQFMGAVQAAPDQGDTLILSGTEGGTAWIGKEFRDFSYLDLSQGSSWTIAGDVVDLETLKISGLSSTDTIKLYGLTTLASTYVSQSGVEIVWGTNNSTLSIEGGINGAALVVAPCFCRGTHIRTPRGEVLVENLRIGDVVTTAYTGVQHIKWIGFRSYTSSFICDNSSVLPICIKVNALGDGIPHRDLWVSPDHAIAEGGVLVHAWRLVNGKTIVQVNALEELAYFHVELEAHQLIFAENCAVETFRDADCRHRFENELEYVALYGKTEPTEPCLPLVEGGFHLYNIQRRLSTRAGIVTKSVGDGPLRGNLDELGPEWLRGWAQDSLSPEEPITLEVIINEVKTTKILANYYRSDLRDAGLGSGCHAFEMRLPSYTRSILVRRVSDGKILGGSPAL